MTRFTKFNPKNLSRRSVLALGIVLVLIVLGIILVFSSRPNKGSGVIPSKNTASSKSSSAIKSNATSATSSPPAAGTKYSAPAPSSGNPPKTPDGTTLVSNHRPSISGSAQQQAEQSICNTSPGASCYIRFTKGSIVKTLAAQTTDASGATYWSWNISDSGFTAGTWQVQAIASLNGQTASASSPIDLEVQP